MIKSVAIFGGTFDPIHNAHLLAADDIFEKTNFEKIIFIPSLAPPHKEVYAPFDIRVQMVELAIRGNPNFECSEIEKDLSKPTYTVNTLSKLRDSGIFSSIALIIGMDSACEFELWEKPDKLLKEFEILVIPRPGYHRRHILPEFQKNFTYVETRRVEISSTEIRKRVLEGKSIRYLTPSPVVEYIKEKGLYRRSEEKR